MIRQQLLRSLEFDAGQLRHGFGRPELSILDGNILLNQQIARRDTRAGFKGNFHHLAGVLGGHRHPLYRIQRAYRSQ
ncbi:MAG: hypothetical protein ACD_75C02313G0004 [uncultured bacterium]|nr:MAG: hypothetical protein ACD_75C02313G0004 [uncultured bacterium]